MADGRSWSGSARERNMLRGLRSLPPRRPWPRSARAWLRERLDITGEDPFNQHGSGGGSMSLREALLGTIEEYARHMGHADLLRERIDGRIGQ